MSLIYFYCPHSYVSCVLGCPYEGEVAPEKVAHVSSYYVYIT